MVCDWCHELKPRMVGFGNHLLCEEDAQKLEITVEFAARTLQYLEVKLREFNETFGIDADPDTFSRRFWLIDFHSIQGTPTDAMLDDVIGVAGGYHPESN